MKKQMQTNFIRSGLSPTPGIRMYRRWINNRLLTIVLLLISCIQLQAQDLGFQWVNGTLGQPGQAGVSVTSTDTDASGNVYSTGIFYGVADFDPGPGVFNMTSATYASFICKYDRDGKLIWARQFLTTGVYGNDGQALAVAPDGSIYVGGSYRGTTDFDPGPGVNSLTGGTSTTDGYIAKLDGNGNFVWVQKIGNDSGLQWVGSLGIDPNGDIIATGEISGSAPTPLGSLNVSSAGQRDPIVAKINPSGVFQWVKRIGGTGNDWIRGKAAIDNAGNIYVGGQSSGNTTGMASLAAGGFVIKLDTNGNTIWADLSTDVTDFMDVVLDASGNVYVGAQTGTVDLVKLNGSGVRQWVQTLGSNAAHLSFGPDGYLYVAGVYSGTTTIGATTLSSNGGTDVYIAKVDASGNIGWAKSIGGPDNDAPNSILAYQPYQLLVGGNFQQTVDFDPNGSTYELTSPSTVLAFSGFVLKLGTTDLTVTIDNTRNILAVGTFSDVTIYVENIKPVATFSAVTVTITKPTASSGLVLTVDPSADWTVAETATQFIVTLVGNIAALDMKSFTAKVTRTGGNRGTYNFTPVIANNSGGDTNNTNNKASVVFTKN